MMLPTFHQTTSDVILTFVTEQLGLFTFRKDRIVPGFLFLDLKTLTCMLAVRKTKEDAVLYLLKCLQYVIAQFVKLTVLVIHIL